MDGEVRSERVEDVGEVDCDVERTPPIHSVGFSDGHLWVGLITGDAVAALRFLSSDTFHVTVTSPPYFWTHDYGVEGQTGHEDTIADYLHKLTEVFDEVRRVLHPQGVLYLNLGDSYYLAEVGRGVTIPGRPLVTLCAPS